MVPPALRATEPVGFVQGAAQVTVNVVPAAIALSKVIVMALLIATLIASSAGDTALTRGAVGAGATRPSAPRIESPLQPAARVASSAVAHQPRPRLLVLNSCMEILCH